MKCLRLFHTFKLTSKLVTVLWFLPEDTRLLNRRQRIVYYSWLGKRHVPIVGMYSFSKSPNPMRMKQVGFHGCLLMQYVAMHRRSTRCRECVSFIAIGSKPDICPEGDMSSSLNVVCCKHNSEKWPR